MHGVAVNDVWHGAKTRGSGCWDSKLLILGALEFTKVDILTFFLLYGSKKLQKLKGNT